MIQDDKEGDNCIILYGEANQMITREQVNQVLSHFTHGDYLVLQNEINETAYIMEKAHEAGLTIVLNPSPMNEKIMKLPLGYVDLFLLNEIEGRQILQSNPGDGCNKQKKAEVLIKQFPSAGTLLTLGDTGSIYINQE